jgi:predicted SAM-dependent methyltransferase
MTEGLTKDRQISPVGRGSCNLCGNRTFIAQGSRAAIRCEKCGSLERTRVAVLFLQASGALTTGAEVVHFAPEAGLHKMFSEGHYKYTPCDYNPSRYPAGVRKVDLRYDLPSFPTASADLAIHNHVLEHIACNYVYVLRELDRILKPGGLHLFSVPIRAGYYAESLDPKLSDGERQRMFLQHDHVRVFGASDIRDTLGRVYDLPAVYDLTEWFAESELQACNIPSYCWRGYTGHSVLCLRKTDQGMRFVEPEKTAR